MIVRSYSLIIEINEDCPDWNAAISKAAIDLGVKIEKNQILPHRMLIDDRYVHNSEFGDVDTTFVRTE